MVRTWWAVLVGALCWLAPGGAEATVLEGCPRAPVAVVPVGGWIPLPEGDMEFSVTSEGEAAAGEEVLVEGRRYWRPEEALPSGTLLEFSNELCDGEGPSSSNDPFQVRVEGRGLLPQVDFTPFLLLALDESTPTEHATCGQDEALLEEAGYCDCADCDCAFPKSGQVPVALAEAWRGKVQWFDGTGALSQEQLLVRQVEWFGEPTPESQWLPLNQWAEPWAQNVAVGEEPLCTTFELLVVPTGERSEVTHCVEPPAESLEAQPVVPRFGSIVSIKFCTLPPEGADVPWCTHFRRYCESVAASEETRLLCRHHYELCGSESRASVSGSGGVFGGSGGATSSGGTSAGQVEVTSCRDDGGPRFGCSMTPGPSPVGLGGVGGGLLLLLGCAGCAQGRRGGRAGGELVPPEEAHLACTGELGR